MKKQVSFEAPISSATTEWNKTGTWRYMRPRYIEAIPPCQNACPNGNNIEAWIRLMDEGKVREAWEIAAIENPFPAIMGRICFHPCMSDCNRRQFDSAVNIQMIERELGDATSDQVPVPFSPNSGRRVAVIGSGPAGLACAYHLRRLGHAVTVFERMSAAGGMLRYGIPSYRLSKDIVAREIARFEKMGIAFKCSQEVRDVSKLRSQFDAAFVSIGAYKSRKMGIPGEDAAGVMPALSFLSDVASCGKAATGKTVVVVGGGNTAIDAARTARRLGASVTILYRRTRAEMPAFNEEVGDAEREGVKIDYLVAPTGVIVKDDRAIGLKCHRVELGEPDESGRRRPVKVPGSETVYNADTVLVAVGEDVEMPSLVATGDGIFAGGDCTDTPRTVVDAIASGKRGAISIDCYLRINSPPPPLKLRGGVTFDSLNTAYFSPAPTAATAREEVARCFHCGRCTECDNCFTFCPDVAISKIENGYKIDYDYCKGCGICARECPRAAMDMISEGVANAGE